MEIENIDHLKPDDSTAVYPEWPSVRCVICGLVYKVEITEDLMVKGDCPRCHNTKFLTQIKTSGE